MKKIILSEQSLYFGNVDMPKGWDIDRKKLIENIIDAGDGALPFSKTSDILNTYLHEHIFLNFKIAIVSKKMFGNVYSVNQNSEPLLQVDPVDLRNSPDFTLLYGVKVKDCTVRIFYEDNRRKGRSWDIPLENNKFIMFPSTNLYYIYNNQKEDSNIIQTITYEYT